MNKKKQEKMHIFTFQIEVSTFMFTFYLISELFERFLLI